MAYTFTLFGPAFVGDSPKAEQIVLVEGDSVLVWDEIAKHYTSVHSLTVEQHQRAIELERLARLVQDAQIEQLYEQLSYKYHRNVAHEGKETIKLAATCQRALGAELGRTALQMGRELTIGDARAACAIALGLKWDVTKGIHT